MQAKMEEKEWKIQGLPASGPNEENKKELMLFGQFVGDWDIVEARYPRADGGEERQRGMIHFRWILEGRGVQDVFSMIDDKTGKEIPAGTTVRFYDPKTDAWQSVWISPRQDVVQPFVAKKVGDEIVLDGKTPDGRYPEKWVFTEIKTNSFSWYSKESHDGGKTWILTEEMRVVRKPESG